MQGKVMTQIPEWAAGSMDTIKQVATFLDGHRTVHVAFTILIGFKFMTNLSNLDVSL